MADFASSGGHTLVDERGTDSAALAAVLGGLADSAATGAVTTADTEMAYIKQILNVLMGADGISSFPAEAAPGNGVSLAEVLRAIHVDVTGIAGSSMRGTDSAALASVMGALDASAAAGVPTSSDTAMGYIKQIVNVLMGSTGIVSWPSSAAPGNGVSMAEALRAIYDDTNAIPTTAMRGTDSAALASVVGALDASAAAGVPTSSDTAMAYIKQIVNVLMGSTGIATWPSGAAPADGVSIAEGIRKIAEDVVTIDAFHDVAVADASTNVHMSDIVGNKSDAAAAGAVSTAESIMAFTKQLVTMQRRVVHHMDFWSEVLALITIDASAGDETLPPITVEEIPTGAVVLRAIVMMKYRAIEDNSGSDNGLVLAGHEHIQIDKTGGTYIDAIKLLASQWQVAGDTRDGGDVLIGNIDVAAEVDGNDTYELKIENADATGGNLLLRDVQTGLRIYFTLE